MVHANISVDFDDRLLAHMQIVIVQKFRRNEPVVVSWLDPLAQGDGRSSMWMTPSLPVYFKFGGSRVPAVNREWFNTLRASADHSTGLIVTTEAGDLARSNSLTRYDH
jgi:hypothetical protein